MSYPAGIALDGAGNLFLVDSDPGRVRKVSTAGIVTTVAGKSNACCSPDGVPADGAPLGFVNGVAADAAGNVYIATSFFNFPGIRNERIRKVSPGGIIATVAGNGEYGFSGDGGPATSAALGSPTAVAVDRAGNLFIATSGENYDNERIRRVSPDGIITTVAGTGTAGFSGDGGPAVDAQLNFPAGLAVDGLGNLFIAGARNSRIRQVSPDGIVTTVADGSGSVAVDRAGNRFIADGSRLRKVSPDGVVPTVASGGTAEPSDGAPALGVALSPAGVALDPAGNVYVTDFASQAILVLRPAGGTLGYRPELVPE